MKRYVIGGDGRVNHAVDPDQTYEIGDKVQAFALCRRPRRLVQVWDHVYDPDDGCTWCNRVIERLAGIR